MTSISPSPVTASPAAAVALVKPKVGGIYNNVPFTGGMRDLLLARSFSLRPYMERDRITVMKVLKDCDSGIKFKLKKTEESGIHSSKTEVNNTRLKNYCCDSVFYMLKNAYYDVLCNHVLSRENTKLKLNQRIILAGLNVTTYHENIIPTLRAVSSEKKKKTTINWREVAPANGGLQMLKKKICV